ncbi:MAG TPA: TrbI/VirB10 family protein [Candidatus Angelobacter sp.]|nr:TrbI/VirB10 family protein [Candidatus Angelobacter sp.]
MSTAPTPQPETTGTPAPAITDRSSKPQGVIPKNMQSWVWIAVVLVVAVAIFFSGTTPKKTAAGSGTNQAALTPAAGAGGLTPEQVSKRLQDSEEAARRNGITPLPPGEQPQPGDPRYNPDAAFLAANQPKPTVAPDPLEEDQRKREYLGRFASNVALSYRTGSSSAGGAASNPQLAQAGLSGLPDPSTNQGASLPALPPNLQQQLDTSIQSNQQQLAALQQQLAAASNPAGQLNAAQVNPAAPATAAPSRKTTNANNSNAGKTYVIFEGTALEAVLINRLNGDFAGPVICQVTTDLYSHDHTTLLIPAGTRVLGETRKVDALGQSRLAVIFHRFIMPDGYAVDLDQAPGLNQIGETALHDKVNNHYFKIFGASIAVGGLAGLATIGTNNSTTTGLPVSTGDAYREGVASSLSQSSLRILDKFLNIPPTITIREGHRVRVFLLQDLQVPAYANHTIPSDL